MKKTIILLDSHAILHRSFHAFPNLRTPQGEPSGALFGMMQMVIRVITDFQPHAIVACFDLPGDTFRHTAFADYKGTRGETDESLRIQIERAHDLCRAWNIPIIEVPGFEADDCIGTLSHRLHGLGYRVIIASGDRDTLQLVHDDDVVVWTLGKTLSETKIFNEEAVHAYYGFGPERVIDYKSLAGDASDNIPGIRGIGDKTARALVGQIGGLKTLYETLEKDPEKFKGVATPRMVELLRNGQEDAEFSRVLATISLDVPIEYDVPEKPWSGVSSRQAVLSFCRQYTFNSLMKKIDALFGAEQDEVQASLFDGVPSGTSASAKVANNKQTSSKNSLSSTGEGQGEVDEGGASEDSDNLELNDGVTPPPTPSSQEEGASQVLTDEVSPEVRKLQIMRWVLDSRIIASSLPEMLQWSGARDQDGLREILLRELAANNSLRVWQEIEEPIMPIVSAMGERGMRLDTETLLEIRKGVSAREQELQNLIFEQAGMTFNLQSPKQLGEVLFTTMKLPVKGIKKNKSGGFSTQESELEKLRNSLALTAPGSAGHLIIDSILEYRGLAKLLSTYIDALPSYISDDGRIHPRFLQDGSATGRFACADPNVQNIPIRSDVGREIRRAFTVDPGYTLVRFDYSQIELRLVALLARETNMLKLFNSGGDIHTAVAARVFAVDREEVTKDMRRRAKTINFGILYGMGVTALSVDLGVTRAQGQEFLDAYFIQFPDLRDYFDTVTAAASARGYTETLFGRRRYLSEFTSPHAGIRAYADRVAMNAPVQGTAADVMKLGMRLAAAVCDSYGDTYIIAQVHDELLFEVPDAVVTKFCKDIKAALESVLHVYEPSVADLVPLLTECEIGRSWGSTKKVDV